MVICITSGVLMLNFVISGPGAPSVFNCVRFLGLFRLKVLIVETLWKKKVVGRCQRDWFFELVVQRIIKGVPN